MRKLIARTVFNRLDPIAHPNETIAVLFHRLAATSYFLYALYGVVSFLNGVPSIVLAVGHFGDYISALFSLLVFISAAPAAYGALTFPRHARVELFSGAAFGSILVIYLVILFLSGASGTHASFAQVCLIAAIVTMPLCRAAFIYLTLVKHARSAL